MRSAFVAACMLIVATYAPDTSVRQQFQRTPAQAQAAPPQRQAQAELDRQVTLRSDIRHGNTSVAGESPVAWRRPESFRPSGGLAAHARPAQPGNRQLPAGVGLLLALALLNGAGAVSPTISQPEMNP
jgi:hypothetical protein